MILDELPTLHQVPSLQPGLAESRQFGGCFVLGVQVASALRDLYGRNGAETISGLCGTRVVLAAPDRDTAQWSADSLGRSEVEEVAEGFSYGANTIRDGVSLTPRRELRALALPSEIMRLRNLSGYLKFPGPFPVASIRLRHVKRPAAAERFVPREVDGAQPGDGADGAAPAAGSGAEGSAETGATAIPDPEDPGKASRDGDKVARDMPPEPAALQEVLALPPPEEPQSGSAAQAGGESRKQGGRKGRRAEQRAAKGQDAKMTEPKDEAPARTGSGPTERGDTLPEGARDSEWM